MRNLKQTIPTPIKTSTVPLRDGRPGESNTFKRDLKSLERFIQKKMDEKPMRSGTLLAILWDEKSDLIEALTPHWQYRELTRAIRRVMQEIGRQGADEAQYLLPGFEDLPKRITIRQRRQSLAAATLAQLAEYLEALERKQAHNPRMVQLKALMELMRPHAERQPEITVREVCERESRARA